MTSHSVNKFMSTHKSTTNLSTETTLASMNDFLQAGNLEVSVVGSGSNVTIADVNFDTTQTDNLKVDTTATYAQNASSSAADPGQLVLGRQPFTGALQAIPILENRVGTIDINMDTAIYEPDVDSTLNKVFGCGAYRPGAGFYALRLDSTLTNLLVQDDATIANTSTTATNTGTIAGTVSSNRVRCSLPDTQRQDGDSNLPGGIFSMLVSDDGRARYSRSGSGSIDNQTQRVVLATNDLVAASTKPEGSAPTRGMVLAAENDSGNAKFLSCTDTGFLCTDPQVNYLEGPTLDRTQRVVLSTDSGAYLNIEDTNKRLHEQQVTQGWWQDYNIKFAQYAEGDNPPFSAPAFQVVNSYLDIRTSLLSTNSQITRGALFSASKIDVPTGTDLQFTFTALFARSTTSTNFNNYMACGFANDFYSNTFQEPGSGAFILKAGDQTNPNNLYAVSKFGSTRTEDDGFEPGSDDQISTFRIILRNDGDRSRVFIQQSYRGSDFVTRNSVTTINNTINNTAYHFFAIASQEATNMDTTPQGTLRLWNYDVVTRSAYPIHLIFPTKYLFIRSWTDTGDPTGNNDARPNASLGSPQDWYFTVFQNNYCLKSFSITIEDGGISSWAQYGNIGQLTNGILIFLQRAGSNQRINFNEGFPIQDHSDWARLTMDPRIENGGGDDVFVAKFEVEKLAGAPLCLNKGDQIGVTMRDDMTGLSGHYFIGFGYFF